MFFTNLKSNTQLSGISNFFMGSVGDFYNVRHKVFHLVTPSPWPFVVSFSAFYFLLNFVYFMHYGTLIFSISDSIIYLLIAVSFWFHDIVIESNEFHTKTVQQGLRIGFLLFVFSEVMVFFGFFWAFFAFSLVPSIEIGAVWPPANIEIVNPLEIPLLNTVLLLMSGAFVTWSHHAILNGDYKTSLYTLFVTLVLASIFTGCQAYEYIHSTFSISDGVYGSVFYFLTGCHGLHVIVGTLFLAVGFFRLYSFFTSSLKKYAINRQNHLGYEFAIWYWHFVDVVWLFLYIFVYCSVHTA